MEFDAVVQGEDYRFSFLNNNSVLVSSKKGDYILYKSKAWRCADDISHDIVEELGEIIDEHLQMSVQVKRSSGGETVPPRIPT